MMGMVSWGGGCWTTVSYLLKEASFKQKDFKEEHGISIWWATLRHVQQDCRKSQFFRSFPWNFIFLLVPIMNMPSNDCPMVIHSCTRPRRTMRVSSRSFLGSRMPSLGRGTRVRNNGRRWYDRKCGESPWQSRGLQVCSEVNLAFAANH